MADYKLIRMAQPSSAPSSGKVRELAAQGVSKVEIARRLGMHRASVYRALASA